MTVSYRLAERYEGKRYVRSWSAICAVVATLGGNDSSAVLELEHGYKRGKMSTSMTDVAVEGTTDEEGTSGEYDRRQLVLHLPIHKTGSTALQKTLWNNEQKLNAAGFSYCPGRTEDLQHKFLVESTAARRKILEDVRTGAGVRSVILSCEKAHMMDRNDLQALVSEVASIFEDWMIKVVVYVRRQDEAFGSFYNQIVKFGSVTHTTEVAFARFKEFFEYDSYLDAIAACLRSKDSLDVRIYERARLKNGDITADFLDCIKLAVSLDSCGKQDNPSMEKSVFKLKLAMNACLEGAPLPLLMSLAGVMADASASINGGKPDTSILSDLEHKLIIDFFHNSNSRLAAKFLRGETFNEFSGSRPDYASSDEIALASVLAHLSRYFFWLSGRGPGVAK